MSPTGAPLMSPLPLLASWLISVAQAQDTLTARIVPSHPRPGERVVVELEYSHGGPDAVRVPTRALDAVVVTGELALVGTETGPEPPWLYSTSTYTRSPGRGWLGTIRAVSVPSASTPTASAFTSNWTLTGGGAGTS